MKFNILFLCLYLNCLSKTDSIVWIYEDLTFNCTLLYHQEGDINIGVVLELGCSITDYRERYFRTVPFLLAIDEINKNPNLLPNITLGFTILNAHCPIENEQTYRKQRLIQFLPDTGLQYDDEYCENGNSHPVWFDVVATILQSFSGESIEFAYITGLQKIPLFTSAEATSDEFTNKDRFPYFFRTVSADSKQVDFMLHFLRAMNWVYVNVIYTEGAYGENAAKQLRLKGPDFGICFEVFHMVRATNTDEEIMIQAIGKLQRHRNARVVIGFFNLGWDIFEKVLLKTNATRDFIFLGSDTVYFKFDGVFRVQPVREMNETFYSKMTDFFYQRDAKILPEDPWIREIYADEYDCTWEVSSQNNCNIVQPKQAIPFSIPQEYATRKFIRIYDVVYLYAKGMDKTLENECQSVTIENKKQLRICVKENLVPNMKFIENDEPVKIKLDENGDAYARWRIYQNQNGNSVLVATYDETEIPKLQIYTEQIDWSVFSHFSTQVLSIDGQNVTTPESVCSKPCKAKEYLIQQELQCCWICRKCLVNEYIVNGTSCQPCPFGQWPDEDTATYCTIIETTFLNWSSWITLLLTVIIIVGLLFTFYTVVFYILKRHEKIIKATTRELCSIILVGIFIAYLTALFYFLKPEHWLCLINRHGFNLSVSLIYSPLFVKTNRVYRIFQAGQKGIQKPKYIGTLTQIIISALLILIGVSLFYSSTY